MHSNEMLIEKFYCSFKNLDAAGMASCYHSDIVFSDPVFGQLTGADASLMWKMLCSRATDLKIIYADIHADDTIGSAHWEATYTFSKTGRRVQNVIEATFAFRDGSIITHDDRFNVWKWSTMALGPTGLLLGWTPYLRTAIKKDARRGLELFRQRQR